MIIWMAERLFYSAAPKILKILEEPPDKTLFILISENHEDILKTIISRTQLVKLCALNDIDMLDYLINDTKLDNKLAKSIVNLSEGNFLTAKRYLNQPEAFNENFDLFRNWMRLSYGNKIQEIIGFIYEITQTGRDSQVKFLKFCLLMFRKALYESILKDQAVRLSNAEKEFLSKFSSFIKEERLRSINSLYNDAIFHIERNGNASLIFLDLTVKTRSLLFMETQHKRR